MNRKKQRKEKNREKKRTEKSKEKNKGKKDLLRRNFEKKNVCSINGHSDLELYSTSGLVDKQTRNSNERCTLANIYTQREGKNI